jgi:hypothetical protein
MIPMSSIDINISLDSISQFREHEANDVVRFTNVGMIIPKHGEYWTW